MSYPIPDLSHIPAMPRLPVVGNSLEVVRDPYGFHQKARDRLGPVYRFHFLGRDVVCAHGAEVLEQALLNREGRFSNVLGWQVIEDLFSGGLMLRDGADHRAHRRMLQPAFRADVMRNALTLLVDRLQAAIASWPVGQPFSFYTEFRGLARAIAAEVFMGITDPAEADRIGRAFLDMLDASAAPIRRPLPFTRMRRGIRARRELRDIFEGLIDERRTGKGRDLFSELCRLKTEDGDWIEKDVLVDHFNFFLFAAFDTATTSISAMVDQLSQHPDWQEAMAAEVATLDGDLSLEALDRLDVTERVLKEAIRLMPPVPFLPRGVVDGFEHDGHRLPKGTPLTVCPGLVMIDPEIWSDPLAFDPDRFSSNRAEDQRHAYAWAPFGGGIHKCLGMNFAIMEAKAFFACLLPRYRIAPRAPAKWRRLPIPSPTDGLQVTLRPASA
ncbi:cytochrome P450 [Rhodovulum sp. P5]|uniref:cytochrome P450 n=1 Tax=Rhodovulum sp. P5 TaxID=1564506 RepID=UPI0009C2BB8E|nr:cytochrome P450 [Rhodovulum sp. P5]ARE38262.1 cytochrome P450 [Rhodovulum sp. P5]